MTSSLEKLPPYLKKYVVEQDYGAYTSQEHATWRYIMRQSRRYFKNHAVDIYIAGLKQTGIPIDRIPRISEMDRCLSDMGWGAVGVEGFVPSSVFLDLLARGVLPIATDMRTLDHVGYTPAPDIVHEAAGHAPIIADPAYRRFLERYSQIAYRSLITSEDVELYEAIRYLSDIKENPDTKAGEVAAADQKLRMVSASMKHLSEAGKVARLAWWTLEYGLVGDMQEQKIYGAGLLSSVSESQACLTPKVRKIPLSLDCLNMSYDITEPQPQLFVAGSLEDLPDILDQFEETLVYKRGGLFALKEMLQAKTLNTLLLEQGISVSGILTAYEANPNGDVEFVKLAGESQICYQENELDGQGRAAHPHGFSTPLGRWKDFPETPATKLSNDQLKRLGITLDAKARITFASGFDVYGTVRQIIRRGGDLCLITFTDCTVKRGTQIYFEPSWGLFDMVVGETVVSVFAGPADRMNYGDYDVGEASTTPGRTSPFSIEEKNTFKLFDELRSFRNGKEKITIERLEQLTSAIMNAPSDNWLLGLEVAELAAQKLQIKPKDFPWLKALYERSFTNCHKNNQEHVQRGLESVDELD